MLVVHGTRQCWHLWLILI